MRIGNPGINIETLLVILNPFFSIIYCIFGTVPLVFVFPTEGRETFIYLASLHSKGRQGIVASSLVLIFCLSGAVEFRIRVLKSDLCGVGSKLLSLSTDI
jgi:hypothetical protein